MAALSLATFILLFIAIPETQGVATHDTEDEGADGGKDENNKGDNVDSNYELSVKSHSNGGLEIVMDQPNRSN